MSFFLEDFVEHLIKNHPDGLREISVVVPGNRARIYTRNFLQKSLRNAWLPRLLTMTEFIAETSQVNILKQEEALLSMYSVYKSIGAGESFDDYSLWAPTALADFNTVETYCLEGEQVFRNLRDIKEIEHWSFHEDPLSAEQQRFMSFWDTLRKLYTAWKKHCLENRQTSSGLAARLASERVSNVDYKPSSFTWFVGLNTLTQAEQRIINALKKRQMADVYWDVDSYYVDDRLQEAGMFLRTHEKTFGQLKGKVDRLNALQSEITHFQTPTRSAQAKMAGNILDKIEDVENVGVVLADENLLMPLLHSLPQSLTSNITLGYSMYGSSAQSLFKLLVEIARSSDQGIYHSHFRKLITHPLIKKYVSPEQAKWDQVLCDVAEQNLLVVRPSDWAGISLGLGVWLDGFLQNRSLVAIQQNCIALCANLLAGALKLSDLEEAQLRILLESLQSIQINLNKHQIEPSIRTWSHLVDSALGSQSVAFVGEPVEGVQIMGVLESRALDFRHVILVGLNEGAFPAKDTVKSFIPHDLRKQLRLPGQKEQDAVFAYYFYRLLHRSEKVDIISTSEATAMGVSEPSRFITQIRHELPIELKTEKWDIEIPPLDATGLEITSNEEVRRRIVERLESGISPSALMAYISCPLDFYHKYVLGLREPKEVEEGVENYVFGNVVHQALDDMYSDFKGKTLSVDDVTAMLSQAPAKIKKYFKTHFPEVHLESGINSLAVSAAELTVERFLKQEIVYLKDLSEKGIPLTIVDLERDLSRVMQVNGLTITLKGQADRIDRVGDTLRIIDYKSGKVEAKNLCLSAGIEEINHPDKTKLLQIMIYSWMAMSAYPAESNIEAGMISLKLLSRGFQPAKFGNNSMTREQIEELLPQAIATITSEMLQEEFVWSHRPEAQFCDYCLTD